MTMNKIMTLTPVVGMLLLGCFGCSSGPIRHVFLAVDQSRQQVLYVNQFDTSRNWVLKGAFRDIQLIGGKNILLSTDDGYREYSLRSRNLLKEVKGFHDVVDARRMADGRTLLACNQNGVTIYELDPAGKQIRHANFKTGQTRLVRLTPRGTFLFGTFLSDDLSRGPDGRVIEGDFDGKILQDITVPKIKETYQALRKPDGNLLLINGYNCNVLEVDPHGKVLRTLAGKASPGAESLGINFFAGAQVLRNGDIVVSNWTGPGEADSGKGAQLVEFNREDKVVWTWRDPVRSGSIHGVIVLDHLNPYVLNDDVSSVLGPVK